ncbi:hypothetical protein FRB95_013574 [Tulasnella sp. JGI-2019a]|nr:hypothetical protein FRB95_013574 [Tulasnella sp. JGI-2019a]
MSQTHQQFAQPAKQYGRRNSFTDMPREGGSGVSASESSSTARPRGHSRTSSFDVRHDRHGEEKVIVDDTNWFDVPLAFAIVPAIGSLLTGSDLLKDFFHLAFLLYYLRYLIRVPWTLYSSARARRTHSSFTDINSANDQHIRKLARTELRIAELTYLAFTIIAPFLGAILLRSVSKLLSIDMVSTFSTSLFVLATGIRPWRHLVDLLRQRTEALHDAVHLPSEDSLISRVEAIEAHLDNIRAALEDKGGAQDMLEAVNGSLDLTRKELKKVEKSAEAARMANEARLRALESAVEALQNTPVPQAPPPFVRMQNGAPATTVSFTIPQSLADLVLKPLDRLVAFASPPKGRYRDLDKTALARAEIVEVNDDDEIYDEEFAEGRKQAGKGGNGKRVSFAVVETSNCDREQEEQLPFFTWLIERLAWIALSPLRWTRTVASAMLQLPLEASS